MGMLDRLDLWTGQFGDEYHARNTFTPKDMAARKFFWETIFAHIAALGKTPVESVLEVGAGTGVNLKVIHEIGPKLKLTAIEPNAKAGTELMKLGYIRRYTALQHATVPHLTSDLVFTCGVLIHIPPLGLDKMMRDIHAAANKYIVCAEYFSPQEEVVPYRGIEQALWRRPYGDLWLDKFPDLQCLAYGWSWRRMSGMESLNWWLFKKKDAR